MSALEYVPAEPAHAEWLAPRLRAADRAEVLAALGLPPEVALPISLRASSVAVTAMVGGEPVAIFGVCPANLLAGEGLVWMLGSDAVVRQGRALLREAPQWLALIGDGYRLLRNHVDARNTRAVRWLRRMGFSLAPAVPFGVAGLPFHPFWRAV